MIRKIRRKSQHNIHIAGWPPTQQESGAENFSVPTFPSIRCNLGVGLASRTKRTHNMHTQQYMPDGQNIFCHRVACLFWAHATPASNRLQKPPPGWPKNTPFLVSQNLKATCAYWARWNAFKTLLNAFSFVYSIDRCRLHISPFHAFILCKIFVGFASWHLSEL